MYAFASRLAIAAHTLAIAMGIGGAMGQERTSATPVYYVVTERHVEDTTSDVWLVLFTSKTRAKEAVETYALEAVEWSNPYGTDQVEHGVSDTVFFTVTEVEAPAP